MPELRKRLVPLIAALVTAISGGFAGIIASQNFQCGCEYGNCGCRPIGTPYITPQQVTPLGPTLIPYVSPTRPTVTLPAAPFPTLPSNPTFVPTIQPTPTINPTVTPYSTETPVPTDTPEPTPTSIITFTPTSFPTFTLIPTPTPTITPTATNTPTPTNTPTNTPTPTLIPTPTPISCPNFTLIRDYGPYNMLVRYTTPPLASPSLQILPTIFSVAFYAGYISGAHEWAVNTPVSYFGLVTLRVYDGTTLVAECNFTWNK